MSSKQLHSHCHKQQVQCSLVTMMTSDKMNNDKICNPAFIVCRLSPRHRVPLILSALPVHFTPSGYNYWEALHPSAQKSHIIIAISWHFHQLAILFCRQYTGRGDTSLQRSPGALPQLESTWTSCSAPTPASLSSAWE